jgi:hypothetical protein
MDQPFDVRRAIEQSSSKSTLQELAKKGIHRVKVLDESMINKLIGEAVERIVSTKTNLLSSDDRQKIIEASRKELDRLMKEHQSTKDQADLMQKDKAGLIAECENLQEQIKQTRKLADETAKQRYEDGKALMKAEVEDLKRKLQSVEEEVGKRLRREIELEFKAANASERAQIEELKRKAESFGPEAEQRVRREIEMEFKLKNAEERAEIEKLRGDIAREKAAASEAGRKDDEALFLKISELFTKSIEGVNKKILDLKNRSFVGGGGGGGGLGKAEGDMDFRPSQATLENLIAGELESNLQEMKSEAKVSGKISGALDRLKAMRGGGGDKKDEPKK